MHRPRRQAQSTSRTMPVAAAKRDKLAIGHNLGTTRPEERVDPRPSGRPGPTANIPRMAGFGKVVGGSFMNATINTNRKGELALSSPGFKKTPNLTVDAVAAWEEIISENRGGAAGAVSKVGQAVSLAALRGPAGKAAAAAVGSTVDLVGRLTHTVRVDWVDGTQSLIQLPDKLFQHLEIMLSDRQIATATREVAAPMPPPPSVVSQLTKLAGAALAAQSDVTKQIERLAALRDQGALTDAEFAAKKAELLGPTTPSVEPGAATAHLTGPPPFSPPPPPPPPPRPSTTPAAWAPDPHGRYELRYWDGTAWTGHVSTGGVQTTDPI